MYIDCKASWEVRGCLNINQWYSTALFVYTFCRSNCMCASSDVSWSAMTRSDVLCLFLTCCGPVLLIRGSQAPQKRNPSVPLITLPVCTIAALFHIRGTMSFSSSSSTLVHTCARTHNTQRVLHLPRLLSVFCHNSCHGVAARQLCRTAITRTRIWLIAPCVSI